MIAAFPCGCSASYIKSLYLFTNFTDLLAPLGVCMRRRYIPGDNPDTSKACWILRTLSSLIVLPAMSVIETVKSISSVLLRLSAVVAGLG